MTLSELDRKDALLVDPKVLEGSREAAQLLLPVWLPVEQRVRDFVIAQAAGKKGSEIVVLPVKNADISFIASCRPFLNGSEHIVSFKRRSLPIREVRATLRLSNPDRSVFYQELVCAFWMEESGLSLRSLDIVHGTSSTNAWLLRTRFEVEDDVILRAQQHVVPQLYFRKDSIAKQACSITLIPNTETKQLQDVRMSIGLSNEARGVRPPKRTVTNPDRIYDALAKIAQFQPAQRG